MTSAPRNTVVLIGLTAILAIGSTASATEHIVQIQGLSFVPQNLTIQPGDMVTWINDGGVHNVNGDVFVSGSPSSAWTSYSVTFYIAGQYPYQCDQHVSLDMTGNIDVTGVFGSGFQSGDNTEWSGWQPPQRPNCNCYFSSDCAGAQFCDWGPGGFLTEDICSWMDGKPSGSPGTGCFMPHNGPWGGPICDGICSPVEAGSTLGREADELIREGIALWADAMLLPSIAGGGPVDPALAEQVLALDFEAPFAAMGLGRQVAAVLVLAGQPGFYAHFCHWEQHPDEPDPSLFVDLSADECGRAATRLLVDGLLAELLEPGACRPFIDRIPASCPDWQSLFEAPCRDRDTLNCLADRLIDTARFLSTPARGWEVPFGQDDPR